MTRPPAEGAGGAPAPPEHLAEVARAAARAPSVHNTQPWRLVAAAGAVELWADRARQLPVADPAGRELTVSVGAASVNAELALRLLGRRVRAALAPAAAEPDLLVRLEDLGPGPPTEEERALHAAIARRHTHRTGFSRVPVPRELLFALQDDAAGEGACLRLVERPGDVRRVADLVTAAEHAQQRDPAYRAELRRWTVPPTETRRDGVPAEAYLRDPHGRDFHGRDFDLGRGWGRPEGDGDGAATLAVLTTPGDTVRDWLRGGRALQRLLLRAATRWVFAALYTQPTELAGPRAALHADLGPEHVPQVVLRLGHASAAPTTPRRPGEEFTAG